MSQRTVLVVDDEEYTREFFTNLLGEEGHKVIAVADGEEALRRFEEGSFDLVLLDLKMPGMSGLDVLRALRAKDRGVGVIVMTGYGTIESAVEAMKLGAIDYRTKPFESVEELRLAIQRALEYKSLQDENRYLREELRGRFRLDNLVGTSPAIVEVYRMMEKVARLSSTILVTGESGTGKELVARTIHENSPRAQGRFLAINCGGLPETLLESTLFGHEKGAFTGAIRTVRGYFEEARGGTIFLDEVGETSPALQIRLLRVLQDRTFQRVGGTETLLADVRIIAATNKDLQEEVRARRFREDLYYRINVITIALPPLRDRRDDIPLLARHFLARLSGAAGREIRGFTPEAMAALMSYHWKGNVRELENVVERAVALEEGDAIGISSLPPALVRAERREDAALVEIPYAEAKARFERDYLIAALRRAGGNVTRAARFARIPRQNFHYKLKRHGVRASEFRRTGE